MRFDGHNALITGGASGIGLATARRMAAEGARLIVWDVNERALAHAAAEFGTQALCQRVDVTDEDAIRAALEDAMGRCAGLDVVINSAGIVGPSEPFWLTEVSAWKRALDLNLTAIFLVCRAVVPHLSSSGSGRIVNLASIAGKEGNANQAAYSASKAGVIGLTKSMAKDLVEKNVLVNAVAPAIVHSELVAQMPKAQIDLVLSKIPMKRTGRVEEIAALVCWLASSECSFSTGAVYDASGGRATY